VYQDISAEYAQNMLVCLPQDLHTFYVYWDFVDLRNQVIRDFLERVKPDCRLVVRLCRLDPARRDFLPEQTVNLVQMIAGNYYFRNLNPLDTYCCEIGAVKPDGGFIRFYQTEPLRMQPVPESYQPAPFAADRREVGQDHKEVTRLEKERQLMALSSWS
jgi:hypothetical protein